MHFHRVRKLKLVIVVCFFFNVFLLFHCYDNVADYVYQHMPIVFSPEAFQIACYENGTYNTLKVLSSEEVPKNTSVFFLETKCHTSGINISGRQACAIESVARMNPNSAIYLLVPSPAQHDPDKASEPLKALLKYNNFKIRHLNMSLYFEGTPIEAWYKQGRLKASHWPQSHASDILRYTTLWKFGGTYIDLDVVAINSLEGMTNYAGAESAVDVAAGFLSFSQGSRIAELCLDDLRNHFRGYDWGYNGPGVITRALQKLCGVIEVPEMTPEKCDGFVVHKPSAFYPIPWRRWRDYFNESHSEEILEKFSGSFAIHVWNHLSSKTQIKVGSEQPYAIIASRYCPKVYASVETYF